MCRSLTTPTCDRGKGENRIAFGTIRQRITIHEIFTYESGACRRVFDRGRHLRDLRGADRLVFHAHAGIQCRGVMLDSREYRGGGAGALFSAGICHGAESGEPFRRVQNSHRRNCREPSEYWLCNGYGRQIYYERYVAAFRIVAVQFSDRFAIFRTHFRGVRRVFQARGKR